MTELITSVNASLFEQYGRQMVDGFEKHADADIRLIVVFEGPLPPDLSRYKRCAFIPFLSPDHQRFLKFFGRLHEARGYKLIFSQADQPPQVEHNYLFDAIRFSVQVVCDRSRKTLYRRRLIVCLDRCRRPMSQAILGQGSASLLAGSG